MFVGVGSGHAFNHGSAVPRAKEYQLVVNRERRKKGKIIELFPLEGPDAEFDPTADPIKVARPLQDQKPERKSKPKGGHGVDRREGAQRKPLAPLPPSGGTRPGSSGDPPIGGPGGGGGGGIVAPPPTPPGIPPPAEDEVEDRIVAGARIAEPIPKRRRLGRKWEDGLDGAKISYKEYPKTKGGAYRNYIIKCTQGHATCTKALSRNDSSRAVHGEVEPLAYLHAWLTIDWSNSPSHSLAGPTREEVDVYVANNAEDLEVLFRSLVKPQ